MLYYYNFSIYFSTHATRKVKGFDLVSKNIFGEYYLGSFDVYFVKGLLIFGKFLLPPV